MTENRQLIADLIMLQGVSKVAVAEYAGVQPSALSHWLNGRPSIAAGKLEKLLSVIGLTQREGVFQYRDNESCLNPRIWRTEGYAPEMVGRCIELATRQFGKLQFAMPSDIKGAIFLYSKDGRWGVLQRCSPVLLLGHKDTPPAVGPGVVQRILDGDTKAFNDTVRLLSLAGRADLEALEVASSIRETAPAPARDTGSGDLARALLEWAAVGAYATESGLSPERAELVLRRFLQMSAEQKNLYLQGVFK